MAVGHFLSFSVLSREVLRMNDGGHVCLDWYNEGGREQPTVLLCPGVTGEEIVT